VETLQSSVSATLISKNVIRLGLLEDENTTTLPKNTVPNPI